MLSLGRFTVRVPDLDAAKDFYTRGLGFRVLFDEWLSPDFRALHVGTGRMADPGLWLLPGQAPTPVADGTDQEPQLVLYSTDLDGDLAHLQTEFALTPLVPVDGEPGARFAHLRDPWGTMLIIAERP